MKKTFLLLLLPFSLFQFSQAQSQKETITTDFFKAYEKDALNAFEQLFAKNKWVPTSAVQTNKIKLKDLIAQLGSYHGYEPITEKRVGNSYVLKSFMVKYERQPIRFTFILYKAAESWTLQNVSFDEDLDDELEAAAKIDRLPENW